MNFKQVYIGFMVVSLLLTIVLAVMFMRRGWCGRREGFESGPDAATAAVEKGKEGIAILTNSLYKTIGFVDMFKKHYGNDFKKERMEMALMSPVELARMHLQSQLPK
jgi:hypothetical protein